MKYVDEDDEFAGIDLTQVSDEGGREVYPATYALMTWWKVRMGNQDTIDISEDSMFSMLQYEETFEGGNAGSANLTEGDEVEFEHLIEVGEFMKIVTLFTYVPNPIPEELRPAIYDLIISTNPKVCYGHFEVSESECEDGEHELFLRYRVTTLLEGIKVGKVDAIDKMMALAGINAGIGLDLLASDEGVKAWLTQAQED